MVNPFSDLPHSAQEAAMPGHTVILYQEDYRWTAKLTDASGTCIDVLGGSYPSIDAARFDARLLWEASRRLTIDAYHIAQPPRADMCTDCAD